ncbi:MAG: lysylphosphatidylglycerol synthase domain-containing protein [Thermoanaerobaculia bacterium]
MAQRVAFAAGVVLLCWLVFRIGPGIVLRSLAGVGWGFLLIVGLYGITVLANTASWRCMLPAQGRRVPLRALAPMLVAGDAVNAVTPTALVGGSLLRVSLLGQWISTPGALAAVGLAAMTQCVAQVLFVLSGLPVILTQVGDARLRSGMMILSAVLLFFLGAVLFLAWSRAPWRRLEGLLCRLGLFRRWWASGGARWRSFGTEMLASLRSRPADFARSVGFAYIGWSVGVVETFLILRLLKAPVDWSRAFSIEVLAVTIEGILFFVPAKMGTQEGGKVLIFRAMGLDPARGLALGLVRRVRELAWAAAGLCILGLLSGARARRGHKPAAPPADTIAPAAQGSAG